MRISVLSYQSSIYTQDGNTYAKRKNGESREGRREREEEMIHECCYDKSDITMTRKSEC